MYQIFRGTYSTVPFNLGHTKQLVLVLEQRYNTGVLNLNISFILFGRFTKTATTINLNLLEPKSQWKWESSCIHISRYYYLLVIRIRLRWQCCCGILMKMLLHLNDNVVTTSWWQCCHDILKTRGYYLLRSNKCSKFTIYNTKLKVYIY